ncbi:MAG: hypothetical protein QM706_06240 [Nitrospira sp.]
MSYEDKVAVIRTCLAARFQDVQDREDLNLGPLFVFNNGEHSWQLHFSRAFIDDIPYLDQLPSVIENRIIPELLANLGMRIEVGSEGTIAVIAKDP